MKKLIRTADAVTDNQHFSDKLLSPLRKEETKIYTLPHYTTMLFKGNYANKKQMCVGDPQKAFNHIFHGTERNYLMRMGLVNKLISHCTGLIAEIITTMKQAALG